MGPNILTQCWPYPMFHVSHVICHVSDVECHVSDVTCHVSDVTKKNYKVVERVGGGSVINGAFPIYFLIKYWRNTTKKKIYIGKFKKCIYWKVSRHAKGENLYKLKFSKQKTAKHIPNISSTYAKKLSQSIRMCGVGNKQISKNTLLRMFNQENLKDGEK